MTHPLLERSGQICWVRGRTPHRNCTPAQRPLRNWNPSKSLKHAKVTPAITRLAKNHRNVLGLKVACSVQLRMTCSGGSKERTRKPDCCRVPIPALPPSSHVTLNESQPVPLNFLIHKMGVTAVEYSLTKQCLLLLLFRKSWWVQDLSSDPVLNYGINDSMPSPTNPTPNPRAKLCSHPSRWKKRKRPTLTISLNDFWELKTNKQSQNRHSQERRKYLNQ